MVASPAPKAPLLPDARNFAFAVRMVEPEPQPTPAHASAALPKAILNNSDAPAPAAKGIVAPQPSQPQNSTVQNGDLQQLHTAQNQPSGDSQRDAAGPTVQPEKPAPVSKNQADLLQSQPKTDAGTRASDLPVFQMPPAQPPMGASEATDHNQTAATLLVQDTHLLTPDAPKPAAGAEILLHLNDGSQSSAAIRVADRAGAVNVSVHASDPGLRESLRSNLGELSAQLNQQGWKADVAKTAVAATHPESQQDSHWTGQRGGQQQQQSSNGDRPQRDRRGNNGEWHQELEQQVSGGSARPGGNR